MILYRVPFRQKRSTLQHARRRPTLEPGYELVSRCWIGCIGTPVAEYEFTSALLPADSELRELSLEDDCQGGYG